MKHFSQLFARLDASTSTSAKLEALVEYLRSAPPQDAAWAVYFLAGGKPRQTVPGKLIWETALKLASIPGWLFDECYLAVGDLAETVALVLPAPGRVSDVSLSDWIERRLLPLRGAAADEVEAALTGWWDELDAAERFLLIKLIGGGFRVGVSKLLITRALAQLAGIDAKIIAQRMMGWTDKSATPSAARYQALLGANDESDAQSADQLSQPYPFFLAHPLQHAPKELGPLADWLVEWKYDGIRGQLIKRSGQVWLWSRGEDLVTDRFPEIAALRDVLADGTAIDGEILVWHGESTQPAAFADLQTRIGRKLLSAKILEKHPVILLAYDLLEERGVDLRGLPQRERRARLEALVAKTAHPALKLSPLISAEGWDELARLRVQARSRGVEGFMLKHRDARYGVGRTKSDGAWAKWKIDPLSVDAVLIYAQRGHGRRASLYTDFTFAVWDKPADSPERSLIPFAKAYSGLSDEEINRLDAIIRKTTIEKFGPVRSVTPTQVFELGFEGIQRSTRHKSGIAVRFPRMLRWRLDKPVEEADTLESLDELLAHVAISKPLAAPGSTPVAENARQE